MGINLVEFGKELKNIRIQSGFKQTDVRKMLGISIETLRLIENGHNEPRISTLEILSGLYRIDLLFLIHKHRSKNDFFSDNLISETNRLIIDNDFICLKEKLIEIANSYELIFMKHPYKKSNVQYLTFFDSLKNFEIDDIRNKEKTIPTLENLLFEFSSSKTKILSDENYFYMEIQIAIILGMHYRKEEKFDQAYVLYQRIIDSYERRKFHSPRDQDYYSTATLNIMRISLALKDYGDIVYRADTLLNKKRIQFSKDVLSDIFMMKAIALWFLNDPNYKYVVGNLLMYETKDKVEKLGRIFINQGMDLSIWLDSTEYDFSASKNNISKQ